MTTPKRVAVIGGGPAGLMAAEVLLEGGMQVDVYDAMPSLGRKFLMAGKSGLNITHAEPFEAFLTHYGARREELEKHLGQFTPDDLRMWAKGLGVETFVGSSGRVFPAGMKASPLLRAWLKRLGRNGMTVHTRHVWRGWEGTALVFDTPNGRLELGPDAVVLALGGASWPRLGSTGSWAAWLEQAGVKVAPFRPANCGFNVHWSDHFRDKYNGRPIKSVVLHFEEFVAQGEFVVTQAGVEGGLIYAASARLRDEIESRGAAVIKLDLAPDASREKLIASLARPRGARSLASHLERTIGFKGVKVGLLREFLSSEVMADAQKLADAIKELRVPLIGTRPIAEAISSAGGVCFEELDAHLMLHKLPGVFCAGEMLDWEAPTGGYLLTACFASGRAAGNGVLEWLV